MSTISFSPARTAMAEAIATHGIPGAVAMVRHRGASVLHEALGNAAIEPTSRPMQLDTVFDLASLTKPLITTPLVLMLVERGLLGLDDSIGRYLAELAGAKWASLTIRRLLTHSSGLPAWSPTYAAGRGHRAVLQAIADLPLGCPPDTHVEYSCLGFILLGLAIERITGQALNVVARDWLFEPLNLRNVGFLPRFPDDRYALTEHGNAHERESVLAAGLLFDNWREDFHPGSVHDGNAFYGLGGVAGNAGLFGTAEDVAALGEMWLRGGELKGIRLLSKSMVRLATSDQTPTLNDARGLGWLINRPLPAGERSEVRSCGALFSRRSFGHSGFTGTSIWIDPENDVVAVLLTNRVHPNASSTSGIIALRHRFHDAVAAAFTTSQ